MNNTKGFTLIELMVVISIIGILAAISLPSFQRYRARAFVAEGYSLVAPVRADVQAYVDVTGYLPEDNAMAGLARPENIRGKYVKYIGVDHGTITVMFNDTTEAIDGYYFKLIPEINEENPTGPLIWRKEKKSGSNI